MTNINNIDYSSWANNIRNIAAQADTDGIKGLAGQEIFSFAKLAKEQNIEKAEVFELLGLSLNAETKSRVQSSKENAKSTNTAFDLAVNYYNTKMDSRQRYDVTQKTYENLTTRLYNMEKSIDNAFIDCSAYQDIVIMPRWHYRYYPYIDTRLTNFDLEELRTTTTKDMESLYELRENVEKIIAEAGGETEYKKPDKKEYDVDKIAKRILGMSYEDFVAQNQTLLESFKYVTLSDIASMNIEDKAVYNKAKAYAKEMLQTTINEAHTTNWDVGDRKTEESLKATGDMYTISEFEYDDITEEGLSEISSKIMYKSFEEALISKHQELDPSEIQDIQGESKIKQPVKKLVNGEILIFNPDGSVFDTSGRRIK